MRKLIVILRLAFILALPSLALANTQDDEFVVKRLAAFRPQYILDNSTLIFTSIDQDENGMIWLSTLSGLYYFDNYNFYEYRNSDVLNSRIISLKCVGDSLYIGTMSGLSIIDLKSGIVSNKLINNKINVIVMGFDNNVLIGTDEGLFALDEKNNDFSLVECFFC